jgi:hypothetical protein
MLSLKQKKQQESYRNDIETSGTLNVSSEKVQKTKQRNIINENLEIPTFKK